MAVTNALLIRYAEGWTSTVNDPSIATYRRREGLLTLGAVVKEGEAIRVGAKVLDTVAAVEESVTVGLDPESDLDNPYFGFDLGDVVTVPGAVSGTTSERVRGLTVTEDDDGPRYVPELRDLIAQREARVARWLKGMINGALNGITAAHSPPPGSVAAGGAAPQRQSILFNGPSPMAAGLSTPWKSDIEADVREITADLLVAGTTDTVVRVLIDGVEIPGSRLTIPAGSFSTPARALVAAFIRTNQAVAAEILSAGAGSAGLLIQVRVSLRA